jgi:hypothetical protein
LHLLQAAQVPAAATQSRWCSVSRSESCIHYLSDRVIPTSIVHIRNA